MVSIPFCIDCKNYNYYTCRQCIDIEIYRYRSVLFHDCIDSIDSIHERVLIGIHNRGVPLAKRIQFEIFNINGLKIKLGSLDFSALSKSALKNFFNRLV